jgi:Asp/Glu/hydantoin racemase
MAGSGSERDKGIFIGILRWESGPQDLSQFEAIPGHFLHPDTFGFPVRFERVKGASFSTVVEKPSSEVLQEMVKAAKEMERDGIRAVTTSCGFNAIFQHHLAAAVSIPVFTSSLLQVPMVHTMIDPGKAVGILTADERFLTNEHMKAVGIDERIPVCIAGIQDTGVFSRVRDEPGATVDVERFRAQVVEVAMERIVRHDPSVGAIVIECTDLPSFSPDIRKAARLPVFDIVTLTNWVYWSLH